MPPASLRRSSPSAWHFELAGFSQIRRNGFGPLLQLTPAVTLGLSAANVSMVAPAGLTVLNWQRHGGTQCAKAVGVICWRRIVLTTRQPENQSPRSPDMPLHVPLELSCGALGGVISAITFASYGVPVGYCGNFRLC